MNRLRAIALFALVVGSLTPTRAAVADSPCFEDLDGNGEVGGGDISVMLLDFGPCPGCGADLDQDGEVSGSDLSLMLLSFGPCGGLSWATVLEWSPDPAVIYDANLRADIAATHWPWRVRDNGTGIEMVLIPPGSFMMGCSPSNNYNCRAESPVHQVTITQPWYLARFEVTQSQWLAATGSNPSFFASSADSSLRPVERVNWFDVAGFCASNGLRLPTEAEWEFAYRAGTDTAFHGWATNPWGSNAEYSTDAIAWLQFYSGSQTRPVGLKAANGFGLYDMAGNVWEWVNDRFGGYESGPAINPSGPTSSPNEMRVSRGGDFTAGPVWCRSSARDGVQPESKFPFAGFRPARSPLDLLVTRDQSSRAPNSNAASKPGRDRRRDAQPTPGYRQKGLDST